MSEAAVKNSQEIPIEYVKLGDVTEVIRGASPRPKGNPKYFGGNIPWIMIADVTRAKGKYITSTRDTVTEEGAKKSRYLKKGTLILSNSGTVCVPKILGFDGCIHDGFVAFPEINSDFDKEFLYHYFNYIRPRMINENRQGITQVNLNTTIVKNIDVPVFELEQQKRIVAKIEELFSHIDAGIEALKKAKQLLKQYRQSVLKAAVTGELTKEWREANKDKLEPASQLLERILKERRQKWEEQQLEKFKAKGKMPKDDKWKEKYRDPASSKEQEPEDLLESWAWLTVEQLNPPDRLCAYGVLQPGPDYEGGVKLIRVGDIQDGKIVFDDIKKIDPEIAEKYPRTRLQGGEVLISLVGAIGRTAVVPTELAGANTARAVGMMSLLEPALPEWVELWFRNPGKILEMTNKSHEVARKTLNLEDVRSSSVAIPSFDEQKAIVEIVEEKFRSIRRLEEELDHQLFKAEKNKQSVLASAFSGALHQ